MPIKKTKYKLKSIIFLLVLISFFSGSIVLSPKIKGEYYRLKVIKAIEDTPVTGTMDIMDGLNIYINNEESKKIILDAFKHGNWILLNNGTWDVTLYKINMENIQIHCYSGQLAIDDDSSYLFVLRPQDTEKIEALIKSLR